MAQLQFDASQVKPQDALDPVPKAWYNLRIVESETKPTKQGDATYLEMRIEIIDGQFANRKVFDRLNLWNPNPVASEIAQRRLSAYCHATGVMLLQDSSQLHGIPFKGLLVVKEDKTGQYEASNELKQIKHINDPSATMTTTQAAGGFAPPNTLGQPGGFTPPQGPANPGQATFQTPAQPQQTAFAQPNGLAQTQQPNPWQQMAQPAQGGFAPPAQPQQQQFAPPQQPAQGFAAPTQAPTGGPVPPWARK